MVFRIRHQIDSWKWISDWTCNHEKLADIFYVLLLGTLNQLTYNTFHRTRVAPRKGWCTVGCDMCVLLPQISDHATSWGNTRDWKCQVLIRLPALNCIHDMFSIMKYALASLSVGVHMKCRPGCDPVGKCPGWMVTGCFAEKNLAFFSVFTEIFCVWGR